VALENPHRSSSLALESTPHALSGVVEVGLGLVGLHSALGLDRQRMSSSSHPEEPLVAFLRPEAFEASLLLQLENIHRPFLPPFLRRNDRVHPEASALVLHLPLEALALDTVDLVLQVASEKG
tara:strand:- start:263 stop:631 length:369 start_codon:yes stop_codon:yes gene_type:complete